MPMQGRDLLLCPGFAAPRDRPCHSPPLPSGMGLEKKISSQGCKMGLQRQSPVRLQPPQLQINNGFARQSWRMLPAIGKFREEKLATGPDGSSPGSRPGRCSFPAPRCTFLWRRVRSAPPGAETMDKALAASPGTGLCWLVSSRASRGPVPASPQL